MKYRVELLDYDKIVADMDKLPAEHMGEVLDGIYLAMGGPTWRNEIIYFWRSLFAAALKKEKVLDYLSSNWEKVKWCFPEGTKKGDGTLCLTFGLPVIGGEDDYLAGQEDTSNGHGSGQTERNFVEQSRVLNANIIRSFENKETDIKNIEEFVAQCIYGGRISIREARQVLIANGCPALADDQGLLWLKKMFPLKQ